MKNTDSARAIAASLALAALGGCAAGPRTQAPGEPGQAVRSACEWVAAPVAFKLVSNDRIGPPLVESMLSFSLEGVDSRCDDMNGLTPLQVLAAYLDDRDLPVIRHVLAQGADANLAVPPDSPLAESQARHAGAAALHFAASGSGRAVMLGTLLDFGGSVAARTHAGATPLHFAAASGDSGMVELLLERGSDIRALDERGWTPLHYAASESEREEVVMALVSGGADIEAADNSGRTPHGLILENRTLRESEAARLLETGR